MNTTNWKTELAAYARMKILIVDDEPQIRRVMRVILSGERYEIVEARSGEAALLQLRDIRVAHRIIDKLMVRQVVQAVMKRRAEHRE